MTGFTLLILVSIGAIAGITYLVIRMNASSSEKKAVRAAEKRKTDTEEREKQEKMRIEMQMHQEEALAMAKNNPELVARVVRNWLT